MIQRFTSYRRNLSNLVDAGKVSHTPLQRNPDDQPQYEGVIWTDGSCTLRWRTAAKSTSVFASFEEMVTIHGHPEYGTEIVFHDGEPPEEWLQALRNYGQKLVDESHDSLKLVEIPDQRGGRVPVAMYVEYANHTRVHAVLWGGVVS